MASTDPSRTTTTDESVSNVLAALQRRRAAMLDGDVDALAQLLDDQLVYTHSTGVRDDKTTLLDKVHRGTLRYLTLDLVPDQVRVHGQAAVVAGHLTATVLVDGDRRSLSTRTLEVLLLGAEGCRLVAFQSTAVTP